MTLASRSRGRVEITLWVLGVALLGIALAATLSRWNYQAQQERALFQGGPALPAVTSTLESAARPEAERVAAAAPAPPEVAKAIPEKAVEPAAEPAGRPERKPRAAAIDLTAFGRIEIPRIGLAAIVKEGGDERTLARAVGLVPGSPRFGDLGNVVLAGHRDTFFRPLRNIEPSDRIRVIVPPHTYEYEVQSVRVVAPEETSVLESRGVEELTLVTCYPFRFVGPAPDRFIVSATRVN
ncbi:MAG TPA: class D sortase [Thermoanaerobaculia bacterium]|nr:class D sortase [Thermoanaerobaculia bacterium]